MTAASAARHRAKDGRGVSSFDGEVSDGGIEFLSELDPVRQVGFTAARFGEDEATFLDLSELCSDLHTSFAVL